MSIEPDVPEVIAAGLRARGHEVTRDAASTGYGRAQIIWRLAGGGYVAGSESRTDGYAAAY